MSELGFAGQRLDKVSGCYPLGNGYRFYSPLLTRFIQADALSPFSNGGMNAYAYCQNDPINRHDPSGRFFEWFRRGVSRLNRWLSPETPPPSRRNSFNVRYTSDEIDPQIRTVADVIEGVVIEAATSVITSTVNDMTRPIIRGQRAIARQWNRLPDQVQSALTVTAMATVLPPVATTLLAAARTGTFMPISPPEFYRMMIMGPTDTQRSALDLRRGSI